MCYHRLWLSSPHVAAVNSKLERISNRTQTNSEFNWKSQIQNSNSRPNSIYKFEFNQIWQSILALSWSNLTFIVIKRLFVHKLIVIAQKLALKWSNFIEFS